MDQADRQVDLVPDREPDPDDVLDGVAGDRDDDEPGERLRDPERAMRRLERLDEPVGDDGRAGAAATARRPIASGSGQTSLDRRLERARAGPAARSRTGSRPRTGRAGRASVKTLSSWAWPASGAPGCGREGRDRQRRRRRARAAIAIVRTGAAAEALDAVAQAAGEERQAEDEQAVGEDRPDERGLDDDDQPGLEREERDEQLGQVAEGRLEDAGLARAEPVAELVGARADDPGEPGEGDRRDDEDRRVGRPAESGGRPSRSSPRSPSTRSDQRGPAEELRDRRALGDAGSVTASMIRAARRAATAVGAGADPRRRYHPAMPTNRLAGETSPYLLQHAHNPVDWYPWGAEALARAQDARTSRSSCRSATPPATGATSWSASRSRTRRPPPS